jgi:hypothetical protein
LQLGDVAWVERSTALGRDALDAPFGSRQDLGWWWVTLDQAVEVPRGPPGEHGARAAGLDGREVARLAARGAVTDAVDAPVFDQKCTGTNPIPDLPRLDPGVQELRPADHAVLVRTNRGKNSGDCPALVTHRVP